MTPQEIFDTSTRRLVKQGGACTATPVQSFQKYPAACLYRGRKDPTQGCAVGVLIPDSVYDSIMEDRTIDQIINECEVDASVYSVSKKPVHYPSHLKDFVNTVLAPHKKLLSALQSAHDKCLARGDWNAWFVALNRISNSFGLKKNQLDKLRKAHS